MEEEIRASEAASAEAALHPPAVRESDHVLMKSLLLLHSVVTTAPSVARSLWRYYGKERLSRLGRFVKETPPHPLLYLAVALAVFGGVNSPYVWAKTPEGLDSWAFFDRLLEQGNVVTTPGAGFGPSGEGFIRLTGFSTPENTKEAIRRIAAML